MAQNKMEMISQEDFLRLKQNPQPYARAAIAGKISGCFDMGSSESAEFQVAAEIAMFLQKDKNKMVRSTLAKGLQQSTTAPKNLILLLANDDQDEVAVPLLRHSPLLEDVDLTQIIRETESQIRLVAIAERRFLSIKMSALIIEKAYEKVAVATLANETSKVNDPTYMRIAEMHHQSNMVMQQMMKRLPMPEQAIYLMKQLARASAQENTLQPKKASSFAAMTMHDLRKVAGMMLKLGQHPVEEQCMALAKEFQAQGRINASVLSMALSLGQLGIFFACLSVAGSIPYDEVEKSHSTQVDKLNSLMVKSGISPSLMMFMQWVWKGANSKLEQGLMPSSRQMVRLMSIVLHEGARRGVNFANTIGLPIANMLDELNLTLKQ